MYGVEEDGWRRGHNRELRDVMEMPLVTDVVRTQGLRWAKHMARMEEGAIAKSMVREKPEGRRPVGKPMMRWMDNIRNDI